MVKDKVEVKACRRCKGLFETTSDVDVCPVCKEALNKVFREVKQFIRKKRKVRHCRSIRSMSCITKADYSVD